MESLPVRPQTSLPPEQDAHSPIIAGCCGAVAGGLIYLKVKGSLPMAVVRMSSSCFSFASVYTC